MGGNESRSKPASFVAVNDHEERRLEENDEFFDAEDNEEPFCPLSDWITCGLSRSVQLAISPIWDAVPKRDVDPERAQDHRKSCPKFVMQCKTCGRENLAREKVWREERLTPSSRGDADQMKRYLLSRLPRLVKNYPYELQFTISNALDPPKRNGHDWRMMASRLHNTFSRLIPEWERMEKPTIEMLRECTETTSEKFLEVLMDMERTDVFENIYEFVSKHASQPKPKYPTQESLTGCSCPCNSLSWPVQEFGSASSLVTSDGTSCRPQQESKETDNDFEADKFWINISRDYRQKSWKDFVQAVTSYYPEEIQQGTREKLLCKALNIDHGQNCISRDQLLAVVALFGPFKPGPDRCLQTIYDSMDKSPSVRDGTKESSFAGHMNVTDAEKFITDQFSRPTSAQAFR